MKTENNSESIIDVLNFYKIVSLVALLTISNNLFLFPPS